MSKIFENVKKIKASIAEAAEKSGRRPEDIILVAATKMNDASRVREAIAAGIDVAGENRVQELLDKFEEKAYENKFFHLISSRVNSEITIIYKTILIRHKIPPPTIIPNRKLNVPPPKYDKYP